MNDWKIILTITTTTGIIFLSALYFAWRIKNASPRKPLSGFTLLVFLFYRQINRFLNHVLGPQFTKFTPLIVYFFFYLLFNSMLAAFIGEPFVSPFRYPIFILLYSALLTLGIIATRVYFQGFRSLLVYLNPIELMSLISSFISISFRLFGNLFAGYLILGLFYGTITTSTLLPSALQSFNVLALIALPLHMYFDLFSTGLHITIFILLAVTYLAVARPSSSLEN